MMASRMMEAPVSWEASGHDFNGAEPDGEQLRASASAMSKPSRPSDPSIASYSPRTFFVTTRTAGGRSLFQTNRMAVLLIDVLRNSMRAGKMAIHDFVIMPNHVHVLMTLPGETSLEKAMQLIKGGFSFRAKKELGFQGEIWLRGYSDVRILDDASFQNHRKYIDNNPVKAGLANAPEEYPYGTAYLKKQKHAAAKAGELAGESGTTEVVPDASCFFHAGFRQPVTSCPDAVLRQLVTSSVALCASFMHSSSAREVVPDASCLFTRSSSACEVVPFDWWQTGRTGNSQGADSAKKRFQVGFGLADAGEADFAA